MKQVQEPRAISPCLRSIKDLLGSSIEATDGLIGKCGDFLLDDELWTIRYLVAETHKWLPGHRVLISPFQFGDPALGEGGRHFRVELTRQEIKDSPLLDVDAPVSRHHERELAEHYHYPIYWGGAGLWGDNFFPGPPLRLAPGPEQAAIQAGAVQEAGDEQRLRSANGLLGTHLTALDGSLGHVADFLLETGSWKVRWMIVDTRNWLPGRKVMISPDWIVEVYGDRKISVDLSKETIKESPGFNPGAAVNRDYEGRLYDYYGRPKYW